MSVHPLMQSFHFRPHVAWTIWQVDLDSVQKYLSSRA